MLRNGTPTEIQKMFLHLQNDGKKIIKNLIELAFYMNGSVSYESLFDRTYVERELMWEVIEKDLKMKHKIK